MYQNNNYKFPEFLKKFLNKIKPRFSFHYVAYTSLFIFIIFSVVSIVTATTPNPGHPWSELGDGVFVFTNSQTTTPYTYTFPAANSTVLTTNAAVTVAQGGTGVGTLTGVVIGNGTSNMSATVLGASQSIRRNATDTAYEAFNPGTGDMLLGTIQTVTAAKTFNDTKLLMRNVADTFSSYFTNTNSAARIYTLPDRALTIDNITTSTTSNGTGFVKANGSVISFDNTTYLSSLNGALLATGTTVGATSQSQAFTNGVTTGTVLGGTTTTSPLTFQTTSANGTTGADMHFKVGNAGGTEAMTILNNGNVGVGATNPGSKLNVNGNLLINGSGFQGYGGQVPIAEMYQTSLNAITDSDGATLALLATGTAGINLGSALTFGSPYSGATIATGGRIAVAKENAIAGDYSYYLSLATRHTGGGISEKMRIDSNGNVGIGTTAPGALLDITNTGGTSPSILFRSLGYSEAYGAGFTGYNKNQFTPSTFTKNSGPISAITEANTLYIAGAPLASGISSSITSSSGLKIASNVLTRVDSGYGLYVDAPTGATSNYAAVFNGGNVGIGTTSPDVNSKLMAVGSSYVNGTSTAKLAWGNGNVGYGGYFTNDTGTGGQVYLGYYNDDPPAGEVNSYGVKSTDTGAVNYFAGNVGIGTTAPTAVLNLKAGTATAGTAPLKFTSGTVLGTTEAGAVEYDGSHLYFTAVNAGTRYQLDQQSGGSTTLQTAYNTGGIIETAAGTPVTITETTAAASTHNLLGLTINPATGGTFTGDALNIVMDAVDLGANTGNGLHIVIDQSQATGIPILVEDDAGVDILSLSQTGGLTIGSLTNRMNTTTYGDFVSVGADIQTNIGGIIDSFVYDTTRDSDGGEWRNNLLSQQLSWYGEAKDDGVNDPCVIASDDRCGLSEFPRKAIIITTADALYIFRADNNLLWMKFSQAGTYALGADANNNPSGVGAQNGVVVVGTNGSAGTGMYAIDFKQDVMYRYNTTNRSQGDKNIANRNTTVTYGTINAETGFLIANNIVNDVSIAVQTASNEGAAGTLISPIDSQAGPLRGVTIIAAANDSGVNVINMGTRKSILFADNANDDYNQVVMTTRGRMYATNETYAQLEEWKGVDTVSVAQATPTKVYDETIGKSPITLAGVTPVISTSPGSLAVIERSSSARESSAAGQADSGDIVFVGTNQGLAEVHTSGGALVNASWSKLTSTTVATPYMVGAARAAYLFDDAVGSTYTASAISATTVNRMQSPIVGTAPTFGQGGVRGNSVNFNNNSYLCSDSTNDGVCDGNTAFNASNLSFTVSLWFKHGVTAANDTLFERCYTPATPTVTQPCIYAGMITTGAIRFGVNTTATAWTYATTYTDTITSTALYNDNQWHHAVFTNTDTDSCLYIDGRQAVACDTAMAGTVSWDAAQVLTIGGTCAGANCVTGANFWDGSIDDFVWSSSGGTTADGLTAQSANKLYLDGRAHLIRPADVVVDATTFTSTTIGKSGRTYIPGSFVGLIVELTGGTGVGQSRTIISNDATTFTVYPAFTNVPDATTDYQVSPAKLYGATNNVTAISVDAPTSLNRVRKVYVGTDDGADGGGITSFTNAGAGSIKTEVIHKDAGFANDDYGNAWTGTGSDNITSISSYSDTAVFGNDIFFRSQRKDISLKQLQTDTIGAIEDIRMELVAQGLFGSTQDVLGLGQGADLAEYYYSNTKLEAGDVVAVQPDQPAGIGKSSGRYQKNLLGVVSTKPGLTLGPVADNAYPIALGGRIPVKITNENGEIHAGDMLTSSSKAGYAMKATMAGAVLGKVINEPGEMTSCDVALPTIGEAVGDGPGVVTNPDGTPIEQINNENKISQKEEKVLDPNAPKCGYAMLFVGLSDSLGSDVVKLAREYSTAKNINNLVDNSLNGLTDIVTPEDISGGNSTLVDERKLILDFLKSEKEAHLNSGFDLQSIYTDRLAAAIQVVTPEVVTDDLYVGNIAEFALPPLFNKDTAGFALIKKGDRKVRINFENPYIAEPAVGAMMVFNVADKMTDALAGNLFENKVESIVVDSDQTGFTILINKDAPRDLRYAWNAFAVKDAQVFESVIDGLKIEMVTEIVNREDVVKTETINTELPYTNPSIDTILNSTENTPVILDEKKDEIIKTETSTSPDNSMGDEPKMISESIDIPIVSSESVSVDAVSTQ